MSRRRHASVRREIGPSRRRLLALLATSPALVGLDVPEVLAGLLDGRAETGDLLAQGPGAAADLASAADALTVLDFEAAARARLSNAHYTWMATGAEDGGTIQANRDGFARVELRSRRLVNVRQVETAVPLFGTTWETPIFLCPVSGHRMYHRDGELATARAARSRRHLQMLSTMTTTAVEEVNAARGEPVWYQLYSRNEWSQTREIVRRVEAAGCPVLVYTIDLLGGRNPEAFLRVQRQERQTCGACHVGEPQADVRNRPMVASLRPGTPPQLEAGTPTWDYVKRLRDATGMKLVLKGIVTREDAELAIQHGVDGVYVSNHGGRADNTLRPAIASLPEVAAGVRGRVPVLFDSGVRRGSDLFKALALGATAVGIGRPYIWGLTSFGQEGVEAVLDILRRELLLTMRQTGVTGVRGIMPAHVVAR